VSELKNKVKELEVDKKVLREIIKEMVYEEVSGQVDAEQQEQAGLCRGEQNRQTSTGRWPVGYYFRAGLEGQKGICQREQVNEHGSEPEQGEPAPEHHATGREV
jgi:siderophore synthetase component